MGSYEGVVDYLSKNPMFATSMSRYFRVHLDSMPAEEVIIQSYNDDLYKTFAADTDEELSSLLDGLLVGEFLTLPEWYSLSMAYNEPVSGSERAHQVVKERLMDLDVSLEHLERGKESERIAKIHNLFDR